MMKYKRSLIGFGVGLVVLWLLALLASWVGGIAIRHQTGEPLRTLTLSQPVVPGTLQRVTWTPQPGEENQPVVLLFRSAREERVLGATFLGSGEARLPFPCTGVPKGTLLMRDEGDQHVIAQVAVRLLPAGRECATQAF